MIKNNYSELSEASFKKLFDSLLKDINNENFKWDLFAEMLTIEDSPLVSLFSEKTLQCAELYLLAKKYATLSDDLESSNEDLLESNDNVVVDIPEVEETDLQKDDEFKDWS